MTYRVQLYCLKYERHTLKEKALVGTVYLTDYSLGNRGIDDIGRMACRKAGIDANNFSVDGFQSCYDRQHDFSLPPSWQHKPGKWEPVCSGSV